MLLLAAGCKTTRKATMEQTQQVATTAAVANEAQSTSSEVLSLRTSFLVDADSLVIIEYAKDSAQHVARRIKINGIRMASNADASTTKSEGVTSRSSAKIDSTESVITSCKEATEAQFLYLRPWEKIILVIVIIVTIAMVLKYATKFW